MKLVTGKSKAKEFSKETIEKALKEVSSKENAAEAETRHGGQKEWQEGGLNTPYRELFNYSSDQSGPRWMMAQYTLKRQAQLDLQLLREDEQRPRL